MGSPAINGTADLKTEPTIINHAKDFETEPAAINRDLENNTDLRDFSLVQEGHSSKMALELVGYDVPFLKPPSSHGVDFMTDMPALVVVILLSPALRHSYLPEIQSIGC